MKVKRRDRLNSQHGGSILNKKSIIIIAAGIAGLSTGCYGQMNGYRTSSNVSHFRLSVRS